MKNLIKKKKKKIILEGSFFFFRGGGGGVGGGGGGGGGYTLCHMCSGTPLIRSPTSHENLAVLMGWPY